MSSRRASSSVVRVCVLQLPALLRRESGISSAVSSSSSVSSSPSSQSSSSSSTEGSMKDVAILHRKQQQMQRIRESLVKTVSLDSTPSSSSYTTSLSYTFERDLFSSTPVSMSHKQIVDYLARDISAYQKEVPFDLLVLPEMWNTPYHNTCFASYAEYIPDCSPATSSSSSLSEKGKKQSRTGMGNESTEEEEEEGKEEELDEAQQPALASSPSFEFMKELARSLRIFVIGGSIVERRESKKRVLTSQVQGGGETKKEGEGEGERKEKEAGQTQKGDQGEDENMKKIHLYNTCCVFDRNGCFIAKHRKIHLFDISILKAEDPNGKGMVFKESDTLASGHSLTSFSLPPFGNVGIGICYDLRFPEMSLALAQERHCKLLCFPGAFNQTTGPPHWSLLLRGRALDNQTYVIGCSPAALEEGSKDSALGEYPSYGRSMIIGPYGDILTQLQGEPGVLIAPVDSRKVDIFRKQIPISTQKRFNEVYTPIQEVLSSSSTSSSQTSEE
ncbi:carbon-nitrogen family protein [Cystoisospora suis]|uniref:Carbon-nitrogen family protein n=1 Tax=Cystoisospora suis TaxID=483139 RepID=A0A2C6KTS9_9APIC|nr:carbon-nitrogen family protein [Cystoisospora suis]